MINPFKIRKKADKFYPVNFTGFGGLNANFSNISTIDGILMSEVNHIIESQAKMLSKIIFKTDVDIVNNLLENPNPFQSKTEFLQSIHKILNSYNTVFIYIDNPVGFSNINSNSKLWAFSIDDAFNVNYNKLEVYENGFKSFFKGASIYFEEINLSIKIDNNNVSSISNSGVGLSSIMFPKSKISILNKKLNNIIKSEETEAVMLENRGAIGVFSPKQPKDGFGEVSQIDLQATQEKLDKYGTLSNQYKYMVVDMPVDFIRTALNINDLGIDETIKRAKVEINNVFDHSILLSNNLEQSTFNNQNAAEKRVYENKIIPDAQKIADNFNLMFAKYLKKDLIKLDLSQISVIQTDKKQLAEVNNINSNIMLNINKSLINNEVSQQTAINLVISLGYSEEEANNLIG